MEIMIMAAVSVMVCGAIAVFAAKNAVSREDFNSLRAQIAENEKTPEGRERNRRFSEFLRMNGVG